MQTDKIHRRSNGTIDIDAYRKEASALRTQTLTRFLKRFGRVATECLLRLTKAFVKYTHEKRSFLPLGQRWCDSTERALSNELMGRHSWFNSKYF
jgi:hypothetical protein